MPELDDNALIIFSQPNCVQCTAAERRAKSKDIPYKKVDVTQVPEALALTKDEWGYLRAPVLYFAGSHAGGYDPDFIDKAGAKLAEAA